MEIHTYSFTWKGGDGLFHTKYLTSASMILAKKEFEKLFGSIERLKAKVMRIE